MKQTEEDAKKRKKEDAGWKKRKKEDAVRKRRKHASVPCTMKTMAYSAGIQITATGCDPRPLVYECKVKVFSRQIMRSYSRETFAHNSPCLKNGRSSIVYYIREG